MFKQLIKYSHYKTIGFQTLSYVGGPLVLYYNFNAAYLFFAWLFSWITLHIGISIGMHRLFTHRTFEPKNNIITVVLHFLSLITTIGGTIAWAATHRTHHKYSDTELDPHRVSGASLFTKIRYWFNYIPDHKVSPRVVVDLLKDPYHKFFNKYYYVILVLWGLALYAIHPDVFMYGYMVATMITLHTASWITVGAHLFGTNDNETDDSSKNSFLAGLYMWGEGWHNNHHAAPWSYAFGWNKSQPDLGARLVELIAKPESLNRME